MRSFGFILAILVFAGGYLAYQEGYLAKFHPLLDPASDVEAEEDSESEPDLDEVAAEEPGSSSRDSAAAAKEKRDQLRKEQAAKAEEKRKADAEKARLAREERAAKQEQDAADKLRAAEERDAFNAQIETEVAALKAQYSELDQKRATLDRNMSAQETAWARETIKTREEDRKKLRDSSEAYRESLSEQMRQIQDQIRAKLKSRR